MIYDEKDWAPHDWEPSFFMDSPAAGKMEGRWMEYSLGGKKVRPHWRTHMERGEGMKKEGIFYFFGVTLRMLRPFALRCCSSRATRC